LTLSTPRPARAPRRALDDLGLPVEAALLDAIVAGEPAWLADDRRAAFEAYQALPGESNLLYTPYIDLRAARLESAAIVTSSGTRYFLRQVAESSLPNLTVLSHNEIPTEVKVRSRGVIE